MNGVINLRGAVLSRFETVGKFADAIGWSRPKASRIINGAQSPTTDEIQKIVECINIDTVDLFMQIFFPEQSIKWTTKSA